MIDTVKPGWLRESLSLELDMRVISNGDSHNPLSERRRCSAAPTENISTYSPPYVFISFILSLDIRRDEDDYRQRQITANLHFESPKPEPPFIVGQLCRELERRWLNKTILNKRTRVLPQR